MIETIESPIGQAVRMTALYDYLELTKDQYSRFVKSNIIENPYFENGKDYSTFMTSEKLGKRGQFRQDYYIHIDAAKKICMVSKSAKGEQIRNELVALTKKVESGFLLSPKQFMDIVKLVKVFAVYEYRQKALSQNQQAFIQDALLENPFQNNNALYAKFHNWRNEALGLGREILEKRLQEYCIINQKAYNRKVNKDEILCILGEYEQIKNAVWDLLTSQKKSKEFVDNIASLAQELSKELKPFMQRVNEANLFFEKVDEKYVNDVFLLS